jgi:hypothetical protein
MWLCACPHHHHPYQSRLAYTFRAGAGRSSRHVCTKSRLWCSTYAKPHPSTASSSLRSHVPIDDIDINPSHQTVFRPHAALISPGEIFGFTQIGGVVCRSPLIAIAAYEREHSIPNDYINCSMSVLPGQPSFFPTRLLFKRVSFAETVGFGYDWRLTLAPFPCVPPGFRTL